LKDNIKMDLKEIWYQRMEHIHLAQDRVLWRTLANTIMNLRVPPRRGISWPADLLSTAGGYTMGF
jgi:hypothetical protein